jgi:alkanesulfonate monooxygenase SsuD/methylene tetrahydromethanopterin reductase-like flavin-dependent oxidoreductase (luciferase family)
MRFGLALPHYDTSFSGRAVSWDGIVGAARAAEAAGFDSVWVSDHLFLDWGKYGGPSDLQGSFECWTTLAALSSVVDLRLWSLTLCNDLRNPALVAKMAATLALLTDGRLELGLGAGWYAPEYEAAGIDLDKASVRIARLGESAEIIRRLLEGEELTFEGDHYRIEGAICRPLPGVRPALWIGGKGDRLLRTVARHADGWNYSWLGSVDDYKQRLEACEQACAETGRDRPLRRSVGAYVLAGEDDADVQRRFTRLLDRTPSGVLTGSQGGSEVSFEEYKNSRVAGTAGEVVDRFGELRDLGTEEVIVTLGALPFQLSDIEDIELLGAEVIPALRG